MPKKRQGYESKLYYGNAGSTAATQVLVAKDVTVDTSVDYGETTDRGDGSKVPRKDRGPVAQDCVITWQQHVKDADASLTSILAAATNSTATPLALKYVNARGDTIFDGDVYIKATDNSPLGDASTYDFEAVPTTDGGRAWTLNGTT